MDATRNSAEHAEGQGIEGRGPISQGEKDIKL